jgi:type IV secretion system protein VirB8
MNNISRDTLEAYYKEAETWANDRQEGLRKSRRIAWIVAGVAAAIALLEGIALVLLTPLKTVVPYTLLVDRQTGFVQGIDPIDPERVKPDAALTQSFLVQYVTARESFDVDAVQTNYRRTALWSAERARADYLAWMQGTNPESPLRKYPRSTVIETRVKSVSPLGRNVAMVRYDTWRRDGSGQAQPVGAWAAIVRYRFSRASLSAEDRYVNPLGFQVLRYRRDPEALPPAEAVPVPVPVPGASTPSTVVVVPGRAPAAAPATPTVRQPAPAQPEVEL